MKVTWKYLIMIPTHIIPCEVIYEMFHILNCGFEINEAMIMAVMNAI